MDAPTGVSVSKITNKTATITWNPVTGATKYTARYGIVVAQWVNTGNICGTSITLKNLEPNSYYHFIVRAEDDAGNSSVYSSYVYFTTYALPPYDYPKTRYSIKMFDRFGDPIKSTHILSADFTRTTNGEVGIANINLDSDFANHPKYQTGDIVEIYAVNKKENKEVTLYNDLRFRGRVSNKRVTYGTNRSLTLQALDFTNELSNKYVEFQYWNKYPQEIIYHMIETFNADGYVHVLKGGSTNLIKNGGFEDYTIVGDNTVNYTDWSISQGTDVLCDITTDKEPRTGFKSLSIKTNSGGMSYPDIITLVASQYTPNLKSGFMYKLDLWAKYYSEPWYSGDTWHYPNVSDTPFYGLIDMISGGEWQSAIQTDTLPATENKWANLTTTVIAKAEDPLIVSVKLNGSIDKNVHVFFDDVKFYEYTSGHDSIANGGSVDWFDTQFDWLELTNTTMASALNTIAKRTNAVWWVDEDMVLWFSQKHNYVDKVIYENNIKEFILEEDATEIKNRGILVGGETSEPFFNLEGNSTTYWSGVSSAMPSGFNDVFYWVSQSGHNNIFEANGLLTTHGIPLYMISGGRYGYADGPWSGDVAQTFQWTQSGEVLTYIDVYVGRINAVSEGYRKSYSVHPSYETLITECKLCGVDGDDKPDEDNVFRVVSTSGKIKADVDYLRFSFLNDPPNLISGDVYSFILKLIYADQFYTLAGSPSDSYWIALGVCGITSGGIAKGCAYKRYSSAPSLGWQNFDGTALQGAIQNFKFKIGTGYDTSSDPYFVRTKRFREPFKDDDSINNYGEFQYQIRDDSVVTPYYAKLLLFYENDKYRSAVKKGDITIPYGDYDINPGDLVDLRGIIEKEMNPGTLNKQSGFYNTTIRSWDVDSVNDDSIITFDCTRLAYSLSPQQEETRVTVNHNRPLWEDMTKDLIDRVKNNEEATDTREFWDYVIEQVKRPNDTRKYKTDYSLFIRKYNGTDSLLEKHKM